MHAAYVASVVDGRCIQLHLPSGEVERLTVAEATQRAEFAAEERAQLLLALSTARHFLSDQAMPIDGAACVAEREAVEL